MTKRLLLRVLSTVVLAQVCTQGTFAQAIETAFGKNRVQYHDDFNNWSRYETENVVTYWYGKAKNVAHASIQIAELEHDDIQELLEYRMNDKVEIVVYTDVSDLKQSNIGNDEIFNNRKGEIKTVGSKAFVYFDGNHQNLRSQIRQAIAAVYINNIINGSSLQEVVQNALLLRLPQWFEKGLISYADQSWNAEINQACYFQLQNPKFLDFDKYIEFHPREAGHSMWYFLENTYGRTKISQIIYITRIYRSLDGSFPYVLNASFETIKQQWAEYYTNFYNLTDVQAAAYEGDEIVRVKKKHNATITNIKLSPQGKYLAYVVNTLGRQDVQVLEIATGKNIRLLRNDKKNPFQAIDDNYPLLAWLPSGESLLILYEKQDRIYLKQQYIQDLKEYEIDDIPENYQRIYSMDYVDEDRILFSGSYDGLSDLFYYKLKSRGTTRISEDLWDDLDASYVKAGNKQGILFRSNRQSYTFAKEKLDTLLPLDDFNIFFVEDGSDDIIQLTNSPGVQELAPLLTKDKTLLYLQNRQNTQRRIAKPFLGSSSPVLNSQPEAYILAHDLSKSGSYVYLIEDVNGFAIKYIAQLDTEAEYTNDFTNRRQGNIEQQAKEQAEPQTYNLGKQFQSKYDDEPDTPPVLANQKESKIGFGTYYNNYFTESTTADGKSIIKYEPYRANAARLKFRIYDYATTLDNEPLFEGLETFSVQSQSQRAQQVFIHTRAVIKDIFEDYTLIGGFRIPTAFNGSEAYLTFEDDKKRWDKSYTVFRKIESENIQGTGVFERFKKHTLMGRVQYAYPFDIFRSVRFTGSLRADKAFFSITDINRLNEPVQNDKRLSARAEYIYDDSYDVAVNIKNGTRYKVYMEAINQFDFQLRNGFNIKPSTGFTTIVGFDARHYIPVLRKSVLALRGTGATSFGSQTMLYYLGGMENWLLPKFDNSIPIPQDRGYSYTAIAPHLRGFNHNIRNGGSFLLTNIEYRLPVFTMLFGNRLKNAFLRNFQATAFLDAGIAWHGFSPYGDDNPLNEDTIRTTDGTQDILVLNITYFRDPLAIGYGWGVRSSLLGYYVKLDFGYGIETGIVQKPKLYLSLGYDF